MSILGYFSHYVSHRINFTNYCKNTNNIFMDNRYTGPVIKSAIRFLDFHDVIHHDTSINKQFINIVYEFINNVVLQGLALVIFIKLIDIRVAILWTFMYATIHNINFLLISPTTHRDHHINNIYYNNVVENNTINIRVIGQRFELNDKYITIIAELIGPKNNYSTSQKKTKKLLIELLI